VEFSEAEKEKILSYDKEGLERDIRNCEANIERMEQVIERERASIRKLQRMIDLKEMAGG
jgi:hypothetical protein